MSRIERPIPKRGAQQPPGESEGRYIVTKSVNIGLLETKAVTGPVRYRFGSRYSSATDPIPFLRVVPGPLERLPKYLSCVTRS